MKTFTVFLFLFPALIFASFGPKAASWYSVNDTVMGGRSNGGALMIEESGVRFAGILSLENNGGFSSIRSDSESYAIEEGKDLVIKVKGDGRTYYFDLRTGGRRRAFSYRQSFQTTAGVLEEIRLPLAGFYATSYGRRLSGASPVDPSEVTSIGITLSDKKAGPFRLDLLDVTLVDPVAPEIVSVNDVLALAVSRGVPLYNRGDADACAAVYETALTALLLLPEEDLPEASRKVVESTLAASSAQSSADERAWTLRHGIDHLMK